MLTERTFLNRNQKLSWQLEQSPHSANLEVFLNGIYPTLIQPSCGSGRWCFRLVHNEVYCHAFMQSVECPKLSDKIAAWMEVLQSDRSTSIHAFIHLSIWSKRLHSCIYPSFNLIEAPSSIQRFFTSVLKQARHFKKTTGNFKFPLQKFSVTKEGSSTRLTTYVLNLYWKKNPWTASETPHIFY